MGEPIRVLHILQRMEAGGTQALLMNIYRKIDRTKVQFDFLVVYKEKQFYDDEIGWTCLQTVFPGGFEPS